MAIKFLNSVNADSGVLYVDAANDRVGIGTTSPGALLNIESSTSPVLRISNGGGTSPNPKLEFYRQAGVTANLRYDVANKVFILDNEHSSGIIDFKVANSNKMRITSAGNVGIGTTSPGAKLEINVSGATNQLLLTQGSTDHMGLVAGTNGAGIIVEDNNFFSIWHQDYANRGTETGITERFRIDTSGNVGIGTTSPSYKLDVSGTARVTGELRVGANINAYQGDASIWVLNVGQALTVKQNTGNVGIGTTSPSDKLTVAGTIKSIGGTGNGKYAQVFVNDNWAYYTTNAPMIYMNAELRLDTGLIGSYNEDLQLRTAGTTRIYASTSGNVGIGTTSPAYKLHVAGTGRFTDNLYSTSTDVDGIKTRFLSGAANNSTNNGTLYLQYGKSNPVSIGETGSSDLYVAGNVGIGTTSPAYKLDISGGDIRINKSDARLLIGWQLGSGGIQLEGGGSTASTLYFKSDRFRFYTDSAQEIVSLTQAGNVGIGDTTPQAKLHIQTSGGSTTAPNTVLLVQANTSTTTLAGGGTAILFKGVSSGGNIQNYEQGRIRTFGYATNNAHGFAIDVKPSASNGLTEALSLASNGVLKLPYYGAGYLKTDANGVVSVDSDTIEDTLDSVTDRGNTTSNNITVGNITANGNITTNTGVFYSGNGTKLDLNQYNAGYLRLLTDNTERVRVTATGNVGIGTTSPSQKLAVIGNVIAGAGAADNYFEAVHSDGSSTRMHGYGLFMGRTYSYIRPTADNTHELYIGTSGNQWSTVSIDSSTTVFDTNGVEHMRITSAGNVGIGTASPSEKLHVYHATTNILAYLQSGDADAILAMADNGGSVRIQNTSGNLRFLTGGTASTSGSNTSEVMRITSSNVGIGTASPSEKLHVSGNVRIEGDLTVNGSYTQIDTNTLTTEQWNVTNDGTGPAVTINQKGAQDIMDVQDDGTSVFYIEDGGNVGIGTTSPDARLEVNTASTSDVAINANERLKILGNGTMSWGASNDYGQLSWDTGYALYRGQSGKGIKLQVNSSSTVMTLDTSGNVGIGTTSPGAKLDVEGRIISRNDVYISSTYPRIWLNDTNNNSDYSIINNNGHLGFYDDTNAAYRFYIKNDGNVGIGTTNPSYKLHVVGSTYLGGDVTVTGKRTHLTPMLSKDYGNEMIGANLFGTYSASSNITVPERALQTGDTYAFFSDGNDAVFTIEDVVIGSTSSVYTRELIIYMHGSFSGNLEIEVKKTDGTWVTAISQTSTTLGGGNWHRFLPNWSSVAPYPTAWSLKGLRFTFSNYTSGTTVYVGQIGITNTQFEKTMPYYSISNGIGYGNLTVKTANDTNVNQGFIVQRSSNGDQGYINYQGGGFQFRATDGDPIVFGTVSNERVRILSDGNVGIGTTSPSEKLHVVGKGLFDGNRDVLIDSNLGNVRISAPSSGGWATGLFFDNQGGDDVGGFGAYGTVGLSYWFIGSAYNNPTMVIKDTGLVGIGTTGPTEELHIYRSNSNVDRQLLIDQDGAGDATLSFRLTGITEYAIGIDHSDGDKLKIAQSSGVGTNDRLTIDSSGNVGIGTTSPSYKLDINGAANSNTEFRAPSGKFDQIKNRATGNTVIDFDASNNVGIGTTSPSEKLEVNGNVKADSFIADKGAGIYTFSDTVNASSSEDIFSVSNQHGAQAFRVTFVCSTSGYSVAKTFEVVHSYGNAPVFFKVVDTGAYGTHDFDVSFTNDATDDSKVVCSITNNSTTVNANIVSTVFLGGSSTTITVTAL